MRIPEVVRQAVFKRDGYKCTKCNATGKLVPHHIIPKCEGGTYAIVNLRTLCIRCHTIEHKWIVAFSHNHVPVLTDLIGTYYKYEDEATPTVILKLQEEYRGKTYHQNHPVYPEKKGR